MGKQMGIQPYHMPPSEHEGFGKNFSFVVYVDFSA